MRKKALEADISLFVGDLSAEPGGQGAGGSFSGDFQETGKRRLWKWLISLYLSLSLEAV